jgi:hypothetical protein
MNDFTYGMLITVIIGAVLAFFGFAIIDNAKLNTKLNYFKRYPTEVVYTYQYSTVEDRHNFVTNTMNIINKSNMRPIGINAYKIHDANFIEITSVKDK